MAGPRIPKPRARAAGVSSPAAAQQHGTWTAWEYAGASELGVRSRVPQPKHGTHSDSSAEVLDGQ